MAKIWIKAASTGDQEMDEIMRKVRKGVVSSIMTGAPRLRAAKWLPEKDVTGGAQK